MTKIKLLAKYDRNEQRDYRQGNTLWENLFWERFISQELVIEKWQRGS